MSPMLISTIIGLVIAVFTLGQVGPSVVQSVYSQTVEAGISKEEALVHQIQQYRTLEGSYPATVADLVSKGYWRTSDNDNGFGGNYTFTVDSTKGVLSISTTIADASRRAQYLGTYKHTFRPLDAGSGVITTAFVLPTTGSQGTPLPVTAIPIASAAPSASSNTYWYDTSSGTAILKVSNGSSWAPTSAGTSTIAAPSSTNIVSSSAQLPTTGTNGDVRYLYNAGTNSLDTYVYFNGNWTYESGGGVSAPPSNSIDYLIAAGGGGGGGSVTSLGGGGGGGAGGLLQGTTIAIPGTYAITVGSGGGATDGCYNGVNGGNSSAFGLTAIGGGGGANGCGNGPAGLAGGSGGGGGYNSYTTPGYGGSGVSGQGNAGGATTSLSWAGGAGGGGAGGPGGVNQASHVGGPGGPGLISSISGTAVIYAKGGDGGALTLTASPPNTGKGGDGAYANYYAGAPYAGGYGVAIIRYPGRQRGTGGVITFVGGYTIHTFTASGTFSRSSAW